MGGHSHKFTIKAKCLFHPFQGWVFFKAFILAEMFEELKIGSKVTWEPPDVRNHIKDMSVSPCFLGNNSSSNS